MLATSAVDCRCLHYALRSRVALCLSVEDEVIEVTQCLPHRHKGIDKRCIAVARV